MFCMCKLNIFYWSLLGLYWLGAIQWALKLRDASRKHIIRSEGKKYYTNIGIKHLLIHVEDSYRHLKFVWTLFYFNNFAKESKIAIRHTTQK
jgi:hypothetical protein